MPNHLRHLACASVLAAAACGGGGNQQTRAVPSVSADTSEAARVGSQIITMQQVDEKGIATNMQAYQQLYDVRRTALENLISEALLNQEAAERGITKEELIAEEVEAKIEPVTDEDVETFFNDNRDRLGGQTLEQIGPQIKEYLAAQNDSTVRGAYLDELEKKFAIQVSLDAPRVAIRVADNEPMKGPPDAAVTIVEYSDFQ